MTDPRTRDRPDAPPARQAPAIHVVDNVLAEPDRAAIHDFLRGPGWAFGVHSDSAPDASRYWYKHFAGHQRDGEERSVEATAEELKAAPPVNWLWERLTATHLCGHVLMRSYANGYTSGVEGALHLDSLEPNHFTTIYYPHPAWDPNFAGETVFFNADRTDIIGSVYPKPNRMVVFRGDIPHVARGVSRRCVDLRITLMFKTAVPPVAG